MGGMARTGRPKARLEVTAVERGELERLARRARTNRHVALRAKIVLRCAHGESNVAVAAKLRCSNVPVGKWRQRVTTGRVDALYDEPKPGAPRTLSDADVESILVAPLESKPKGRPTGAPARWRSALASVPPPWAASGAPAGCSRMSWHPSRSPTTRWSSRRCGTLSAST